MKKYQPSVITKRFASILSAAVLTMMSTYVLMLTDSIIASQYIGRDAVSAITLVSPIISLIIFIAYTISSGAALTASFERGRANDEEVNRIFSQGFLLSVAFGVLMTVLLILFTPHVLMMFNVTDQVKEQAQQYFMGFMGMPLYMSLYMFFYNMYVEEGRENICFIIAMLQAGFNVILSLLLGSTMGTLGISLATAISLAYGTAMFMVGLKNQVEQVRFVWCLNRKTIKDIWIVGFNDSMDNLLMTILPWTVSMYIVNVFGGEDIIYFTIVLNGINLIGSFLAGLADTMESLVCLYFGEKNYHGVKKVLVLSINLVMAVGVLTTIIFFFLADNIPTLFAITDPHEVEVATRALRAFAIFIPFYCLEYTLYEYYGSIDHARYSMICLTLLIYIFPIICMTLGGILWEFEGAWFGMGFGYIVSVIFDSTCARIMAKGNKKLNRNRILLNKSILENQIIYDVPGTPESVMATVHTADEFLRSKGVDDKTRVKIELMMEEMGMQAIERQKGGVFNIEYTIQLDDHPTLIIRDNGKLTDEVEEAENLSMASLRSYTIAQMAQKSSRYRPAGDKNRTIFQF